MSLEHAGCQAIIKFNQRHISLCVIQWGKIAVNSRHLAQKVVKRQLWLRCDDLNQTFPANSEAAFGPYVDALVQDWGADPYNEGRILTPLKKQSALSKLTLRLRLRFSCKQENFLAGEATHPTYQRLSLAQFEGASRTRDTCHKWLTWQSTSPVQSESSPVAKTPLYAGILTYEYQQVSARYPWGAHRGCDCDGYRPDT